MNEINFRLTKMVRCSTIPQDSAYFSSGPNNDDSSENGGGGANLLPPSLSTFSAPASFSSLSEGLASSANVPLTLSLSTSVASLVKASTFSSCRLPRRHQDHRKCGAGDLRMGRSRRTLGW